MKYIKKFESISTEANRMIKSAMEPGKPYRAPGPNDDEYAVCQDLQTNDPAFGAYLKTAIGRILLINKLGTEFLITFEDMPKQLDDDHSDTNWFFKPEILHTAKNKEDLRIYVDANKYNL